MSKNKNKQPNTSSLRAPVVTIMGHVDHGKTTLLDNIRKANVAMKEFGGITQHVSCYQITFDNRPITFIDTPGHEAFFAMRERGAKITDILILVVAADDGVMPQTKEVISLWKKMNVQMIVAINKIDTPGADIEKVKRQLSIEGVYVEGYGGDIPFVEISAKSGKNVDKLLDLINLVAEMNGLDQPHDISNAEWTSESIVLESFLDKSLGPVASVIVKAGNVKRNEFAAGGKIYGRVRALINDQNQTINEGVDGQPIKIIGIPKVLDVGEIVRTYSTESLAVEATKNSINEEIETKREEFNKNILANLFSSEKESENIKSLNIILLADTRGSLEAIEHALKKITIPDTQLNILDARTGNATLNDVNMAQSRGGIILVFNTKIEPNAVKEAEKEGILVREYKIIYELVEEIEGALIGLVEPTEEEEIVGEANVIQVFQLTNGKWVAGCRVVKNTIYKGYQAHVMRDNDVVYTGKITSLKHLKQEVKDAKNGTECGILIEPNEEMRVGDKVVCFKMKKVIF